MTQGVEGPFPMDPPVDPETDGTWPRVDGAVLAVVFVGGALGGAARAAVQDALPLGIEELAWPTLTINCVGAFLLAILLARPRPRSRLVRPLLGTGLLGGWTTFSAVVVTADQQLAHGHAVLGVAYLAATAAGGFLCAACGFLLAGRGH